MKVFIARHGEASFDAPSDHERPLTPNGEAVTRKLVEANLEALNEVEVIWCSHLKRAIQTADIYAGALSIEPIKKPFLSPESQPARVIKEIEAQEAEFQSILLVSHQPLVGDLVSLFGNGNIYGAHPFSTSEVVVLEMDYPGEGMASQIANFLPY